MLITNSVWPVGPMLTLGGVPQSAGGKVVPAGLINKALDPILALRREGTLQEIPRDMAAKQS